MPRRIASQVPQTVSRLLQGGYLKSPPLWYESVTSFPPASLPPRAPVPRTEDDIQKSRTASSSSPSSATQLNASVPKHDRRNLNKRIRAQSPKLSPRPIVYLEDRIRRQFFRDHPWESFDPRILAEGAAVNPNAHTPKCPPHLATDLRYWGRNPGPEDVVSFTAILHKHHGLSLSAAYHRALSSYHALRAEHEHATRYAVLEARAYGAYFGPPQEVSQNDVALEDKAHPSASPQGTSPENLRGFNKETQALSKWANANWGEGGLSSLNAVASAADEKAPTAKAPRVKPLSQTFTRGHNYLVAALAARDGRTPLLRESSNPEDKAAAKEQASPSQPILFGPGAKGPVEEDPMGLDSMLKTSQQ